MALVNRDEQIVPPKKLAAWRAMTVRAYVESGLFSRVVQGGEQADLVAKVRVEEQGEFNRGLAIACGLTLTLVPAKASSEFTVTTSITDGGGKTLGFYEKKEAVATWIEFFLMFAAPFAWPNTVVKEAIFDLSRATLAEARGKKVL